jgi:hypothetical protein
MKRFEVIVAGTTIAKCETREDAEQALKLARRSFLAMAYPQDAFYIKEIEKKD